MSEKQNLLWNIFTAINGWITFADAKAMGLLAINGVIAGMIFVNINEIQVRLSGAFWASTFAVLGILTLLLSFFFALGCILPRLSLNPSKLAQYIFKDRSLNAPTSSLYFDHIAQMSLVDYENKVQALFSEPEAIKQITQQIWMNAQVASRKHRDVNLGAWALAFSVFFCFISLMVILSQSL